jgi:hypothetical protein
MGGYNVAGIEPFVRDYYLGDSKQYPLDVREIAIGSIKAIDLSGE